MNKKTFLKYFLALLLFLPAFAFGGQITKTLTFNASDLKFRKDKNKGYDIVEINGYGITQTVGYPMLPQKAIQVLIPYNAVITDVEVLNPKKENIPGTYKIYPTQPPQPVSAKFKNPIKWIEPDSKMYKQSSPFPENLVEHSHTGNMGGYRIASFLVSPLQYVPAKNQLVFYSQMDIRITYEEDNGIASQKTEHQKKIFQDIIKEKVINPEFLPLSGPLPEVSTGTVEYVIITADSFVPSFQPLIDWKIKKGVPSKIIPLSFIYSNYSGRDNAEQIRNFIKDANTNWGTIWVLLGGQCDYENKQEIVPRRDVCYMKCCNYKYPDEDTIPSDLYFSDLDGTWNNDNDLTWGERPIDGDTVDLCFDVFVGRAPVRTKVQVQTFVNKVLTYEKNPPSGYLNRIFLPAGELFPPGNNGNVVPDTIASRTPAGLQDIKLYEINGNLSQIAARDTINKGAGFTYLGGHGDEFAIYLYNGVSNSYLNSDVVDLLSNGNKLGIVTSAGCMCGAFDLMPTWWGQGDCFAEHFLTATGGGAVASIMNSRYGWGSGDNSIYLSDQVDTSFYHAVFIDKIKHLGQAHAISKDNFIPNVWWYGYWPWVLYELNLFGDPELPMWTDEPKNLNVTYNATIPQGPNDFTVTVKNAGGTPVESAYVCCMMDTTIYLRGYTNSSGVVNFSFYLPDIDTVLITTTAYNYLPKEGYTRTVSSGPYPASSRYFVDDDSIGGSFGNADSAINTSETIQLPLLIKNYGSATTYKLVGTLSTSDTFVTLLDTVKSIGTLTAGSSVQTLPYLFNVKASCPNKHIINFKLTCKDSLNKSYLSYCPVTTATHSVFISPVYQSSFGFAECVSWYKVAVKNTGTTADSYNLSVTNNSWPTTFWDSTKTLQITKTNSIKKGDSANVFVKLSIPSGATYGKIDTLKVYATSIKYPEVSQYGRIKTTVKNIFTAPFSDGFEGGLGNWCLSGTNKWRICTGTGRCAPNHKPYQGDSLMNMTCTDTTVWSDDYADIYFKLAGQTDIFFDYYFYVYGHYTPPPCVYVDIYDGTWHLGVDSVSSFGTLYWDRGCLDLSKYNMIDRFIARFRCHINRSDSGQWYQKTIYADEVRLYKGEMGSIAGTVYDKKTSLPIPGAIIMIDGRQPLGDTADINGHYQINRVLKGTYSLTARATNYFSKTNSNITVSLNQTSTSNFYLTVPHMELIPDSLGVVLPANTIGSQGIKVKNTGTDTLKFEVVSSKTNSQLKGFPLDTIRYENGGNVDASTHSLYGARFTPDSIKKVFFTCEVKAGLFYIRTPQTQLDTMFLYDDNNGEPGTLIEKVPFTVDSTDCWYRVPLSKTYKDKNDFWFYVYTGIKNYVVPAPANSEVGRFRYDSEPATVNLMMRAEVCYQNWIYDISPAKDTVLQNDSANITATFDANIVDFPDTTYKCWLKITSNDLNNPTVFVPTTLTIIDTTCPLFVTSPNGGEKWTEMTTKKITWSKVGSKPNSYRMLYYLNPYTTWDSLNYSIASAHPYSNDYDNTWTICNRKADSIKVHFTSLTIFGAAGDTLFLNDKHNNSIVKYPKGTYGAFWSPAIPGHTVKVRLFTDYHWTAYGFAIDKYKVFFAEGKYDTIAKNISPDSLSWNWTLPDTHSTTCRVKVQMLNASNTVTVEDKSDDYFSIVKDTVPPATFSLVSPADSAVFSISKPTFLWRASSDTESGFKDYKVYIDSILKHTGTDTIWTADYNLNKGSHKWYVTASDNAGNSRHSNTTRTVVIANSPGDVRPSAITGLPDTVFLDSTYSPKAYIINCATDTAPAFQVICKIDTSIAPLYRDMKIRATLTKENTSSTTTAFSGKKSLAMAKSYSSYIDTQYVSNLAGKDTIAVTFDNWVTPFARKDYKVTIFTKFLFDTIPSNDTISKTVCENNNAPVVSMLPDTSFPEDDSLKINLDNYVYDSDDAKSSLIWSYSVYTSSKFNNQIIASNNRDRNITKSRSLKQSIYKNMSKAQTHILENNTRKLSLLAEEFINVRIDSITHIATITGAANWNGTRDIIFTANDPWGESTSDTLCLTVIPVNDPPGIVYSFPVSPYTMGLPDTINLRIHTEDPDNDTLQYIWSVNGIINPLVVDTIYQYCSTSITTDTIKVKVTDKVLSDSNYWVVVVDTSSPSVNIVHPDSGEIWLTGASNTIKWQATDNNKIDSVSICLSFNSGVSYPNTIAHGIGIANDSTYVWPVIDTFSTTCKLKIVAWDIAGNIGEGRNKGDFLITPGTKCDVKCDKVVDILDITRTVGIIQGYGELPNLYELWAADAKGDSIIDVLDIISIVKTIQNTKYGLRHIFNSNFLSNKLVGKSILKSSNLKTQDTAMINISSCLGTPGSDSNMVYINLENSIGVAGVQIKIAYDTLLLRARDAKTTPRSNMMSIDSKIGTNYIQILLFNTSLDTIASDTGSITGIPFYVSPNATPGDSTLLHIGELTLSDINANAIPSQGIDSWFHFKGINTQEKVMPNKYEFSEIYPNPVATKVILKYAIPEFAHTILKIYDMSGKLVKTLVNGTDKPGYYSIAWNSRDEHGKKLAKGVYFVKLEAGKYKQTRKLILMK
ncbi:MAG: C25 family cysteine peptidase [bacterium]